MLVELGPVAAAGVLDWTRFARRMIAELRVDPGDLEGVATEDLLAQWSQLIDDWATRAGESETFRWSMPIDSEVAEFLLHGLERCYHSPKIQARLTDAERQAQRPFTVHVIQAFIDGLDTDGVAHVHYADQVRGSIGSSLD